MAKRPRKTKRLDRLEGRRGIYTASVHNHLARKVCELGATDHQLADVLGISIKTLYQWRHEHPNFAAAMKLGKEIPDEQVKRMMFNRAVGYNYEAEELFWNPKAKTKSDRVHRETVIKHVPPDVKAQQTWLAHRDPQNWGQRALSGDDNGNNSPSIAAAQDQLVAKLFGIATRMRPPEPRLIEGRAVEEVREERGDTDK